jgi:hypothetical protein
MYDFFCKLLLQMSCICTIYLQNSLFLSFVQRIIVDSLHNTSYLVEQMEDMAVGKWGPKDPALPPGGSARLFVVQQQQQSLLIPSKLVLVRVETQHEPHCKGERKRKRK